MLLFHPHVLGDVAFFDTCAHHDVGLKVADERPLVNRKGLPRPRGELLAIVHDTLFLFYFQ